MPENKDFFKNGNELYFAKVNPNAIIPTKKNEDAGYDIYSCEDHPIVIAPHTTEIVHIGIACAVSPDYYLQVEERSSIGTKGLKKSAGIIDSGYRGEIMIALTNTTEKTFIISNGDLRLQALASRMIPDGEFAMLPASKAIAQLIVHRVHKMDVKEISYDELQVIPSERGTGGWGSTGK